GNPINSLLIDKTMEPYRYGVYYRMPYRNIALNMRPPFENAKLTPRLAAMHRTTHEFGHAFQDAPWLQRQLTQQFQVNDPRMLHRTVESAEHVITPKILESSSPGFAHAYNTANPQFLDSRVIRIGKPGQARYMSFSEFREILDSGKVAARIDDVSDFVRNSDPWMAEWLVVKGEVKVVNGVAKVPLLDKFIRAVPPGIQSELFDIRTLAMRYDGIVKVIK
ncbi:MAG: hypothetical protein QXF55_04010, partial [Candidatus Aenigmatarchaeota archaeon]